MRTAGVELQVLNAIQVFYSDLLSKVLNHPVPAPQGMPPLSVDGAVSASELEVLRHWINLLDLAITPVMVRDAFKANAKRDIACALLQHYAWKGSLADTDRDKTDFIVTFLFRNPPNPGDWTEKDGPSEMPDARPGRFEAALREMTSSGEEQNLPSEHRQLAREFFFLREEMEDFRHFNELMDSSIVQRVRDIKESFGPSLYHPHVLASIAAYNTLFGKRFDALFHAAVREIKEFAEKVLSEGASIMSRVHGDVTVKQLADLEEAKILGSEYQRSMEYFQRIARFKKAVDLRKGIVEAAKPSNQQARPLEKTGPPDSSAKAAAVKAHSDALEENKVEAMEGSIRDFIRAAGSRAAVPVVPLRQGTLGLVPAEAEAFRAEYVAEKSFRADYARTLVRSVSLIGRMLTELADYRAKQHSSYLWKPHADSLAFLLRASSETLERARQLAALAQQRGLGDKANGINACVERLQEQVKIVADALRSLGASTN